MIFYQRGKSHIPKCTIALWIVIDVEMTWIIDYNIDKECFCFSN